MNERYPAVAVGAFIMQDDAILLIRRGTEPYKGQWSIPGGKVEWGERREAAVQREVAEETGLQVRVGELAASSDLITRQDEEITYHYIVMNYWATVIGGVLQNASDADDVRWVKLTELATLDVTPSLVKQLRELQII